MQLEHVELLKIARELGYPPLGVSENAGFTLALSEKNGDD